MQLTSSLIINHEQPIYKQNSSTRSLIVLHRK